MSRTLSQFQSLSRQQQYNNDDDNNNTGSSFASDNDTTSSILYNNKSEMNQFLSKLQDDEFFYNDADQHDSDNDPSTQFATITNFPASLSSLNSRLLTQNLISQPLSFESTQSQVHVLNLLYRLLTKRQQDVEFRESLADQMSRLQCDNRNLKNNLSRCKQDLENSKRSLTQDRLKYKTTQQDLKRSIKKLTQQLDKSKLQNQNLLQKQIQYEHKLHRQEFENNKLKARIQKLVQSKGAGLPNRMDLVNPSGAHKKEGRSTWKHGTKQNDDSLYQNIVGAFQDEKQEIVQENSALRQSLRDLTWEIAQVRRVLHARGGGAADQQDDSSMIDQLNDGQFELPYHIAQEEIESTLQEKIAEISSLLERDPSDQASWMEKLHAMMDEVQKIVVQHVGDVQEAARAKQLLQKLYHQAARYENIIQQQNLLMQCDLKRRQEEQQTIGGGAGAGEYFKSPLDGAGNNVTSDELLHEERELLNERRRTLDERQRELERKAMELDEKALRMASNGPPHTNQNQTHNNNNDMNSSLLNKERNINPSMDMSNDGDAMRDEGDSLNMENNKENIP